MFNLSMFLEDSARNHGDRQAIVAGDLRLSYKEIDAAANQIAQLLRTRGIRAGDKVAISCPNPPQFPSSTSGFSRLAQWSSHSTSCSKPAKSRITSPTPTSKHTSASRAPLNYRPAPKAMPASCKLNSANTSSSSRPIRTQRHRSWEPKRCSTLSRACHTRAVSVATEPTDTALIIYTSGTTGQAKGAELTHANIVMNVVTMNRMLDNKPAQDTHVVALPLFHAFGATMQLLAGFSCAATLILIPRFEEKQVISLMEKEKVTFFAGVPTMWLALLEALTPAVDTSRIARNLRAGVSGGASLPVDIINRLRTTLGIDILEGYGLSEASTAVTFNQSHLPPKPGSVGTPVWGIECKLINNDWSEVTDDDRAGEIAVRGHNIMKGYYKRAAATAEVIKDGWFRTGDLARRDADGYYHIADRTKDLIIRGGYNVYPREIEEVLVTHPEITLAAVIGIPHDSHGGEIKAFAIRASGSTITGPELIAWAKEQMAAYKYPRFIDFVETLPTTATGKILKRELT